MRHLYIRLKLVKTRVLKARVHGSSIRSTSHVTYLTLIFQVLGNHEKTKPGNKHGTQSGGIVHYWLVVKHGVGQLCYQVGTSSCNLAYKPIQL